MRKIVIPEGKQLFIPIGKYLYKGPMELEESRLVRKSVPVEFTDGTQWQWTNEDGTTDPPEPEEKPQLEQLIEEANQPEKKSEPKKSKRKVKKDDSNEPTSPQGTTQGTEDKKKDSTDTTGN